MKSMDAIRHPDHAPPCLSCRHFLVLMGDAFPYQCRLWEFKCSLEYPARTVYSSTGKHCPYYLKRRARPDAEAGAPSGASAPPASGKEGDVDLII